MKAFASRTCWSAMALGLVLLSSCSGYIVAPSNRYAIVIGISDYLSARDLEYPDDDAAAMAAILSAKGWRIDTKNILTNEEATKEGIEAAIARLANKVGSDADATVLLYYSGHGASLGGEAYLVPYDASFKLGIIDPESLISAASISSSLDALDCDDKLLIVDACYSGGFIESGASIDASSQDASADNAVYGSELAFETLFNFGELLSASLGGAADPGILAISACGSEELSYDDDVHLHGVFSYYLIAAAEEGDANFDGCVTATEAFAYARRQIEEHWNPTNKAWGTALLPHISGGTGDLVLFVNN